VFVYAREREVEGGRERERQERERERQECWGEEYVLEHLRAYTFRDTNIEIPNRIR